MTRPRTLRAVADQHAAKHLALPGGDLEQLPVPGREASARRLNTSAGMWKI